MDFLFIHGQELSALMGLSYLQQSTYLLGIRPYMDRKTFMVGIKRRISYQQLAEALYVEPHQGIKSSGCPSRPQLRRVIKSLERAGLVKIQSNEQHLILKCLLANPNYSAQNKADTNPSQQADSSTIKKQVNNSSSYDQSQEKNDRVKLPKAGTPHNSEKKGVCIGEQFQTFWTSYPQPCDEGSAWNVFQKLNPSEDLFSDIMAGLQAQIKNREALQLAGEWVPKWKYPANWLAQHYWKQPLQTLRTKETSNENYSRPYRRKSAVDILAESCKDAAFEFDAN